MMIRMEEGVQANNGILNIMAGGEAGILKFTFAPGATCLKQVPNKVFPSVPVLTCSW